MSSDEEVGLQLDRLNTEDYIDRIDVIMDVSSSDNEKIIQKLIEIAVSAMRGKVRVAAAIGFVSIEVIKK